MLEYIYKKNGFIEKSRLYQFEDVNVLSNRFFMLSAGGKQTWAKTITCYGRLKKESIYLQL